jgi:hypothetical protein
MLEIRADRVSGAFTAKTPRGGKRGTPHSHAGALAALRERPPGNADTLAIPDEAVASERRAGAAAARRGCRTNHSEFWSINWPWDATIRMTDRNGPHRDGGSKWHSDSPDLSHP